MPNLEGIWRSLYRPCLPHVDSAALSLRHLSLRLARYPAASQSLKRVLMRSVKACGDPRKAVGAVGAAMVEPLSATQAAMVLRYAVP